MSRSGKNTSGATERIARRDGKGFLRPAPLFILVEPQMGENIGATARAMLNFGLSGLRIVNPRDGWPNEKAGAMSAGASIVIDQAQVFSSTREGLADCTYALATTARSREALLPVLSPEQAATELKSRIDQGEKCAVLFGGERAGLSNDDVMRCDGIISIPVNPAFASLNLAQAALVVAYEWAKADARESLAKTASQLRPAAKANFERFFDHLVNELDRAGYFFPEEKRPNMERNLKVAFQRAGLTESETRSLHGVIKALVKLQAASER
ncbi:RNA methyltransferase [Hyphococcus flavus]|uniref:tRNA (cytidine/uridine-2'-O-)-methyltransferase TrmJ n=1 Tax=Hyphococcus flavus TaxID=1866326 RepID=A0AAE9ZHL1_9PROT|nr:RNA methyltransferase [Hyphococcus flavus]WDI30360.1 RNA methyltransferase [Hyphococcus flavus]